MFLVFYAKIEVVTDFFISLIDWTLHPLLFMCLRRAKLFVLNFQSISPGYVATEIFNNCGMPGIKKVLEEKAALVPEDLADAVLYALGTPPHVQVGSKIL